MLAFLMSRGQYPTFLPQISACHNPLLLAPLSDRYVQKDTGDKGQYAGRCISSARAALGRYPYELQFLPAGLIEGLCNKPHLSARGAEKAKNKSPQLHHAAKRTYSKLMNQLFELSEAPVSDEKISAMAS